MTGATVSGHEPLAYRSRVASAVLGRGLAASVAGHAALVATALIVARGRTIPPPPPVYRVALIAAPAAVPARASADASTSTPPGARHDAPTPSPHRPAAPIARARALTPPSHPAAIPASAKPSPAKPVHPPTDHSTTATVTPTPSHAAASPSPRTSSRTSTSRTPPSPTPTAAKPIAAKPTAATKAVTRHEPSADAGAHAPRVAIRHTSVATAASGNGTPTARGHDVADVRVVGLEFPFPGYLANLVRQVRLRFEPTDARAGLHADLAFVVGRDGSITALRVVRSSGNYAFDLEAQGAVEAAGSARAFGPLPDGFTSASLPVTFSFDPRSTP